MKGAAPYLILFFVLAAFLHAPFLLYVVYAVVLALFGARWWARKALSDLEARRIFERRMTYGESFTVTLELRNRGRMPLIWVEAVESLPLDLSRTRRLARVFSLAPGQCQRIEYTLIGRKRGVYPLGPLRLTSGDLLGQDEFLKRGSDADHVIVYPQIVPLMRLGLPSLSPLGQLPSRDRLYADPARVAGVRDYAPGDSVREIHWSASAAAGSLQVKVLEPAMNLPTALLLDLSMDKYERGNGFLATERGIVVAASLIAALGQARQEFALFSNGVDVLEQERSVSKLGLGKGQGHLVLALELLARLRQLPSMPFHEVLDAAHHDVPWGATIVAILPPGDEQVATRLLALRRQGFRVIRIVLGRQGSEQISGLTTFYVNSIDEIGSLTS